YLMGAEWNWVTPFKTFIEATLNGKPRPNFLRGGLKDGYVKTSAYGSMVTQAAKQNADAVKAKMMAGSFEIFRGQLKNNQGKVMIHAGTALEQTDPALEKMNYLVEGVIGSV